MSRRKAVAQDSEGSDDGAAKVGTAEGDGFHSWSSRNILDYFARLSWLVAENKIPFSGGDERIASALISSVPLDQLSPSQLTSYLSSTVRLQSTDAGLCPKLPSLALVLPAARISSARVASELLAATVKCRMVMSDEDCAEVLGLINDLLRRENLTLESARTLATLLWCTARVCGGKVVSGSPRVADILGCSTALLESWAYLSTTSSSRVKVEDASMILWSYAKVCGEGPWGERVIRALDSLLENPPARFEVADACLSMWAVSKLSRDTAVVERILGPCEDVIKRFLDQGSYLSPAGMTMVTSAAARLQRKPVVWPPPVQVMLKMSSTQLTSIFRTAEKLGWCEEFQAAVLEVAVRHPSYVDLVSSLSRVPLARDTLTIVLESLPEKIWKISGEDFVRLLTALESSGHARRQIPLLLRTALQPDQLSIDSILSTLDVAAKLGGSLPLPHLLEWVYSESAQLATLPLSQRIGIVRAVGALDPSKGLMAVDDLTSDPSDEPILISALCAGLGYLARPPPDLIEVAHRAAEVAPRLSGVGLAMMTKVFAKHRVAIPGLLAALLEAGPAAEGYDDPARCLMVVYLQRLDCLQQNKVVESLLKSVKDFHSVGLEELVLMVCAVDDELGDLEVVQSARLAMEQAISEVCESIRRGDCRTLASKHGVKRLDGQFIGKVLTQLGSTLLEIDEGLSTDRMELVVFLLASGQQCRVGVYQRTASPAGLFDEGIQFVRSPYKAKQASYALSDRIKKATTIDQLVRILRTLRASAIESDSLMDDLMTAQNRLDWLTRAAFFGGWRYGYDRIPEEIKSQIFKPLEPDDLAPAHLRQYLAAVLKLDVSSSVPLPSATAVHAAAGEGSLTEVAQLLKVCVRAGVDVGLILQEVHRRILELSMLDTESLRSLSSTAWAAAQMEVHHPKHPAPALVLSHIAGLLRCSLSDPALKLSLPVASEILWSFATSPSVLPSLGRQVALAVEASILKDFSGDGSPRELATIMWSLARLDAVGELFSLCESTLSAMPLESLSPAVITMACSALGRARRVPPPPALWPPSCADLTATQLATVVRASAVLGWSDAIETAVKTALSDHPLYEALPLLLALSAVPAARELLVVALDESLPDSLDAWPASAAVDLVTVLSRSPSHQARMLEACELVRLNMLSADECCSLLTALASSGVYDGRVVEGVLRQVEGRLQKDLSPSHKAALMKAYATLLPSAIGDIWERIASSNDLADSRLVAATCWALGNRSLPTAHHLRTLSPSACRAMKDFDGVEVANVARAFAKHRVRSEGLIEAIVEAVRGCPPRMDDRARCSILWSLRRLGGLTEDTLTFLLNTMGDLRYLAAQELVALANATHSMSAACPKYDDIRTGMEELLDELAIAVRSGDISKVEDCKICNVGPAFVGELLRRLKIPYEITALHETPEQHIGPNLGVVLSERL
ncbi:hypothetical protein FOZ62_029499 [Perkinsus olseni]|uniref:Uncharacterized protein n=1 Tax=Perkinsus olseni TaxID=32597 RepID=A0A7J6U7E1_PEROL|nr:hypothetical protein FOZ62_029499 [Perkinsus olseni]